MLAKRRPKGRKNDRTLQAVGVLVAKFSIDRIYLYEQGALRQFTIWLSEDYRDGSNRVFPKIISALRKFGEFQAICYIGLEAIGRIRRGNLYLARRCRAVNMVYCRQDDNLPLSFGDHCMGDCITYAKERAKLGRHRVDEFMEGYLYYFQRNNLVLAALMLHQAIELTYRYMEQVFTQRERTRHSIAEHHAYLSATEPQMSEIFDTDLEADAAQLNFLDSIYLDSRYSDRVKVDRDLLLCIAGKFIALRDRAMKVCSNQMELLAKAYPGGAEVSMNLLPPMSPIFYAKWIPTRLPALVTYIANGIKNWPWLRNLFSP